jgi:2-haloacid dehalogenase
LPLDFSQFDVLSFDCYGTLIDWESGILAALQPLLACHGATLADDVLLERFAALEALIEAGPYRPYRVVLREVVRGLGAELGFVPNLMESCCLEGSLPHWPPFDDTIESLRTLQRRFRLIILSNTDDDLFTATVHRLGIAFNEIITAQQVGSYKPSPGNFQELLRRGGVPRERLLHVAQSLFHDIAPARALGIATVWVNRRHGRASSGATAPAQARPDLEVPDLRTLAVTIEG